MEPRKHEIFGTRKHESFGTRKHENLESHESIMEKTFRAFPSFRAVFYKIGVVKKIAAIFAVLLIICGICGSAYADGNKITPELWIRAVIHTEDKGNIEAVWKSGGEDVTGSGDRVIWGYFYADPGQVSWGSPQNPDLFVKIWFDHTGRLDVNFFHVSVPDIDVFSDYPYNGTPDEHGTATMTRRYIRHCYESGKHRSEENDEDGKSPLGYRYATGNKPSGYATSLGIFIAAVLRTEEKGSLNALWLKGGEDTTASGEKVIWGYFYAPPEEVTWGNKNNPDLFAKIWFDASGRLDVNFFHVSAPDIEVYSDLPYDSFSMQKGATIPENRYVRHEYSIEPDCPTEEQNRFVYKVMTDSYLWYDTTPKLDYTTYSSPEALLKDLRNPQDKWSYISSTEEYSEYYGEGVYVGLGLLYKFDSNHDCRVAFVHKDSPADKAGLIRGDKFLEIGGKTIADIEKNNLWDAVTGQESISLKIEDKSGLIKEVTLKKERVNIDAVLDYTILKNNGVKTAYLAFTSFIETAQEELDSIFAYFKQEKVEELILDIRYNKGGQGSVAQYLASLIAGERAAGKVFAKSVHNDKYSRWNTTDYFTMPENALNLPRVICITGEATCSASEMLINGLKPFLDVVQVGAKTCGKPVGMHGWDFCNIHISPIEFKVVNADNEGDYFSGLIPDCSADDDMTRALGDIQETSLKHALHYLSTGLCPDNAKESEKLSLDKPENVESYNSRGAI